MCALRIVAIVLMAVILAGCGGGAPSHVATSSDTTPVPTTPVVVTPAQSVTTIPNGAQATPPADATHAPTTTTPGAGASAQAVATAPAAALVPASRSNRVTVGGGAYFLLGADYPWLNFGNDFGSNAFGSYGFHTGGDYATDFAAMAGQGVHVVRLYAFTDGRSLEFDASGTPTGVSPDTMADFDAALVLARQYNVYLDVVLLDFSFFFLPSSSRGVQFGGHSDVFTDPAKRDALIAKVIAPVIARYAGNPYLLSWELMNEPEWAIGDLPQASVNKRTSPITMAEFWAYGSRVAALVHAAGSRVTVGSACLKWNKVWTPAFATSKGLPPLGLDYYQTHYYEWMDGLRTDDADLGHTTWSPLTQPAAALGLDAPIVVGEIVDKVSSRDTVWANGYAGYWPWSYRSDKTVDHFSLDGTYSMWERQHAGDVAIPPQ